MLKEYYKLTKPGIIRGNVLAAAAGFLLAARGEIDGWLLLATLAGTSLVIASACVFNNYIDRNIDMQMARTRERALVTGRISGVKAILFGAVLGIVGFGLLTMYTNGLTVLLGLIAFVFYVIIYGIGKRKTVHGTLIGTIPGALPPVAGYTAVTNELDSVAALLFLILVFWQMPHFYAIGMYRQKDYAAAALPILPVKKGFGATKLQMLLYVIGFICVSLLLVAMGYAGYTYATIMLLLGLGWLRLARGGFEAVDSIKWAKQMFGYSLLVLLVFCVCISLEAWLP